MTLTGAEMTVEALSREGVTVVFGLPGTTIMDLIDVIGERSDMRYIPVRHEQVAAMMADGYARGSGRLGVCMASRGPGAANLAIGVHNAHAEGVPVLALVGQVPDKLIHRDAFEEMDLLTFFAPMTKWSVEIHVADRTPELVQRACRSAQAGRPGAVLVSLPQDVQVETVASPRFQPQWRSAHPAPNKVELSHAVDLLETALRPAIIVGGGVPDHSPAVIALAEAVGAPVVSTWLRESAFPSSSPAMVGVLGYGAVPATELAISDADVVLALGTKLSEFSTNRWTLFSADVKLIHVDVDEAAFGRAYVPEVGLLADAEQTASSLLADFKIDGARGAGRAHRVSQLRDAYLAQTHVPDSRTPAGKVSSAAVLSRLQTFVDQPNHALVLDAAGFGTWVHRYLRFTQPDSFYGAAGGSMGWGLPAAMGVQVARPEARVVLVAGDGSFWMVAQDIETAVREDLPVLVVVMNNFAFGNTRDRQRFTFGARYHGVFYSNPDFAAYARLLGAHGERVESDEEFAPAFERALASGRPAIIDVIQDRMEGLPVGLEPPLSASKPSPSPESRG